MIIWYKTPDLLEFVKNIYLQDMTQVGQYNKLQYIMLVGITHFLRKECRKSDYPNLTCPLYQI